MRRLWCSLAVAACATGVTADPSLECSARSNSQVETGQCLVQAEADAIYAMNIILEGLRRSATELDQKTGPVDAVPALEAAQAAWTTYRDANCDFVSGQAGGGSGTGIMIRSCRIDLIRARTRELAFQLQ